jgi:hypothetical protein
MRDCSKPVRFFYLLDETGNAFRFHRGGRLLLCLRHKLIDQQSSNLLVTETGTKRLFFSTEQRIGWPGFAKNSTRIKLHLSNGYSKEF